MIFCLLWGPFFARADLTWVPSPDAVPVYMQPRDDAPLLTITEKGERIAVRKQGQQFSRIQILRDGKWATGFMKNSDLTPPEAAVSRGKFGFGGGGLYSYLYHGGKKFSAEDQVEYTTEPFSSLAFSPFLLLQYKQRSFWRLIVTYRQTSYTSSTSTDVSSASKKDIKLAHTMLSGTIQKMWTPFAKPNFYFGLGLEVSRALKADLKIGGSKLPVENQDLPTYFGAQLASGYQFDLLSRLSGFVEARVTSYVNQSPIILGGEVAAGLIVFP